VAIARALAGAVPYAGQLIPELITEVVPGQRLERIEDWLRRLAERLAGVEEAVLRAAGSARQRGGQHRTRLPRHKPCGLPP
jgi:hypothetical protein